MDDRPDSMRSVDSPGKEGDSGDGCKIRFRGEQMSDLMDREPNGRETEKPEEEEAEKVLGVRPRVCRHRVRQMSVAWPDRLDHQCHTLAWRSLSAASQTLAWCSGQSHTSNPRLYSIPYASDDHTINDRPQRPPDPKRSPAHDGKGDMIHGADTAGQAYKTSGNKIAEPNADP